MTRTHPTSTLLFGGSFDPVHHGHLIAAQRACEELHTDRVVFLPAARSPHKIHRAGGPGASGDDRLEMLRRATAAMPHFDVSDVELRRAPPSYTIDTLEALSAASPDEDFIWLLGADQLPKFHAWHRIRDILALVRIAVLGRPGSPLDLLTALDSSLHPYLPRITPLTTPLLEISATDIRARIAAGKPITYLVPEGVAAHICNRGLYR